VPFNATPTVALYDLTFANTMANIDPVYQNDTLVLGFGGNFIAHTDGNAAFFPPAPYTAGAAIPAGGHSHTFADVAVNNELVIKIPKGNYTLSDLERQIALEILKTKDTQSDADRENAPLKDFWTAMNIYAQRLKYLKSGTNVDLPTNPKGIANPNIPAQFSAGTLVVNTTPPLTFSELNNRLNHDPTKELPVDETVRNRYIKPVTFRANPQTNRLEVIIVGPAEFRKGSTLATKVLGFDESQLATKDGPHWQFLPHPTSDAPSYVAGALTFDRGWDGKKDSTSAFQQDKRDKQKPQRLDSSRVINFHLPGLVKGSYDRNGAKGNGRVATVPITVAPGAVEQWQVQTPLYMPCDVAGAYINSIVWFITNEEGKTIDLQGGRMSATVIVRWPAVPDGPVPPSSLAARTDPNIVRMPWAGTL
jgi:hypothetical protein